MSNISQASNFTDLLSSFFIEPFTAFLIGLTKKKLPFPTFLIQKPTKDLQKKHLTFFPLAFVTSSWQEVQDAIDRDNFLEPAENKEGLRCSQDALPAKRKQRSFGGFCWRVLEAEGLVEVEKKTKVMPSRIRENCSSAALLCDT